MRRIGNAIDHQIRELAQLHEPTPEEAQDLLYRIQIHDRPRQVAGRRHVRRYRRRAVFGVVFAVMLVSAGVTIAQLSSDGSRTDGPPALSFMQRVMASDAPTASIDDYRRIESQNEQSGQGKQLDLASRSASRVLVDRPDVGSLVVVPDTKGEDLCYLLTPPPAYGLGASGGCGLAHFTSDGLSTNVATIGDGTDAKPLLAVFGVAADDVTRISVVLGNGSAEAVALHDNLYLWTNQADRSKIPEALSVTRDGNQFRTGLEPTHR